MSKILMAANWKMFKTGTEARDFINVFAQYLQGQSLGGREILILPPFTALHSVAESSKATGLSLGAQNLYPADKGAFTGEVAPHMLKELGCDYVLTGHSERRHVLGESDQFVGQKTAFALQAGLRAIFCVGESLEERRQGQISQVLHRQLETGLVEVPRDVSAQELTIAYEPVWAIGTGEVAKDDDIVQAHTLIRSWLRDRLISGQEVRILYGGSVKPDNCAQILGLDNVDGVLVGGASLEAASFAAIVSAGLDD